jgi:hypothetical protein
MNTGVAGWIAVRVHGSRIKSGMTARDDVLSVGRRGIYTGTALV